MDYIRNEYDNNIELSRTRTYNNINDTINTLTTFITNNRLSRGNYIELIYSQDIQDQTSVLSDTETDSDENLSFQSTIKYDCIYKLNLYSDNNLIDELETNTSYLDNDECPICLESLNKSLSINTLCNHKFHKICIDNWLYKHNICPICRLIPPEYMKTSTLNRIKKKIYNNNYYELSITNLDKFNNICNICDEITYYYSYIKNDYLINQNLLNICKRCYNKLDTIEKETFILKDNTYEGIEINNNLFKLCLNGLILLSNMTLEKYNNIRKIYKLPYLSSIQCTNNNVNSLKLNEYKRCQNYDIPITFLNIKYITINNTFINNPIIFNSNNVYISNTIINNNIIFNNITHLFLYYTSIKNTTILNNIIKFLNKNIITLVIDKLNIEDKISEANREILYLDIKQYKNIEKLNLSFDKLLFNKYSFDLSNHKIKNLTLKNIITKDLILDNKLNINKDIININLEKIIIRNKKIDYLDFTMFKDLENLMLKRININKIISLSTNLKTIVLNNLNLNIFPDIDFPNSKCNYLNLAYNNIYIIPDLDKFTELYDLKLNNNKLNNLPKLPTNLNILYADYNHIELFPDINNMSILNLSNNLIKNIPNILNIDYLNLSNNKIKSLDLNFNCNISNLNIEKNKITNILSLPKTIKKLNCSYNYLKNINLNMLYLRELKINNNKLEELYIKRGTKIKYLDCANNNIKKIIFGDNNIITCINYLNIKNNDIDILYFKNISKLKYLNIRNNNNLKIIIINKDFIQLDKFYFNIKLINKIIKVDLFKKNLFILFATNNSISLF